MALFELSLVAPEDLAEAVSDALMEGLDALSVTVEDADADTAAERALFGEPGMPAPSAQWQRSTLKALFEDEAQATAALAWLLAQDEGPRLVPLGLAEQAEQDWVRLTQSQFAPVPVTEHFWVVPTWHEVPPQARTVMRLDPGLAFGTGTHPTTRMCLRWIARQAQGLSPGAWPSVLDYGCGSGILAIAAALHGATHVHGVDLDPAALQATQDNARANGVQVAASLPPAPQHAYGWVLANILASPLKLLAPLLCQATAPGGHLLLAGVLERQTAELQQAYAPWLALEVADSEDGWVLLHAQAPSA